MKPKKDQPEPANIHPKLPAPPLDPVARVNRFVNLPTLLHILQNDLKRLSTRERQVFELRGQGLLEKEIAAELHIDVSSVKTYLHRANKKLSACLAHAITKLPR